MAKLDDLTGRKFRSLTAIRRVENSGVNCQWEFLCDCGKKTISQARYVKRGKVTNCGCVKLERRDNLEGKRFGKLTALKRTDLRKGRNFLWQCSCDCGGEKLVPRPDLTTGNTTSCGCGKIDRLEKMWASRRQENPISATKEYKRKFMSDRRIEHPWRRVHERMTSNIKHALKKINIEKDNPTFLMLGYSPEDLCIHIEKQFDKKMSWENIGEWHIDHIRPISGAKNIDDIIELNQLYNLRPMWAKDNLSKGAKRTHLL